MGVETPSKFYTNFSKKWKLCRDVIEGDDAVKSAGVSYIPKLSEQTQTEYEAMLNRPTFENRTERTLDAFSGLIFAKKPIFEASDQLKILADDINLEDYTLTDLSQEIVSECLTVGRVGILVDMPNANTEGMTKAQSETYNLRPYLKIYKTEHIINWRHTTINNAKVLSMIVLSEVVDRWIDPFTSEQELLFRVLELDDMGYYRQLVYRKHTDRSYKLAPEDIIEPKMNGKRLNFIPFICITPSVLSIEPINPPIYDLAKVNLAHFKLDVDFYHGLHFTALPTPYASGVQLPDGQSIKIGSSVIHLFPDPSAKMAYLEFTGDGLQTIEREKQRLIETMAQIGSRMLADDKKTAEAENTVAMRSAGERATLISIADTVSRGVTKALEIMAQWMGDNSEIIFELNTDYSLVEIDPQLLTALVSANQMGVLPSSQLYYNLKKGELIEEGYNYEDYQSELETAPIELPAPQTDNSLLTSIRTKLGL